jgi:hypothetical protein
MTVFNFCGWGTQDLTEACYSTTTSNATQAIDTGVYRTAGASLKCTIDSDNGYVWKRMAKHGSEDMASDPDPNEDTVDLASNDIWGGFAVYIDVLNGGVCRIAEGTSDNASTQKWDLRIADRTGLKLLFSDTNGVPVATGSTILSSGTWYYVETRTGTGADASYEVRLDGSQEMSGTCDQSVSDHWAYMLNVGENTNAGTIIYLDDFHVNDSGFFDPCKVHYLSPTGDGNYTSWAGTYADVDDPFPHDSTTTEISTSTENAIESVVLEDSSSISDLDEIRAVKGSCFIRQNTAQGIAANILFRESSTDDHTPNTDVVTDQTYGTDWANTRTTPPAGGSWTTTKLDTIEVGAQHTQKQVRELTVTRIQALVLYNPTEEPGEETTPVSLADTIALSFIDDLGEIRLQNVDFGNSGIVKNVSSSAGWNTRLKSIGIKPISFINRSLNIGTIPLFWRTSPALQLIIPIEFLLDIIAVGRQSDIPVDWFWLEILWARIFQ